MKKIKTLALLLAAVLSFAACKPDPVEQEPSGVETKRTIVYSVDDDESRKALETDAEWDAMLDRFCDYAQSGSTVSFYTIGSHHSSKAKAQNDNLTIATTDRAELKEWMKRMEGDGRTVTVTYDKETGTWNGKACVTLGQQPDRRGNEYTGVLCAVPNPALSDPVMPGMVWALRTDDTLFYIAIGGYLVWSDAEIVTGNEGNTVTLYGVTSVEHDINDEEFYVLELSLVDESNVVGRWQFMSVSNTQVSEGTSGVVVSYTITEWDGDPATALWYDFEADGTLRIEGSAEHEGTWSLSQEGDICSELFTAGGGCWSINWLSESTMILSRLSPGTELGDIYLQLEFTR